jgi:hypothetical protein
MLSNTDTVQMFQEATKSSMIETKEEAIEILKERLLKELPHSWFDFSKGSLDDMLVIKFGILGDGNGKINQPLLREQYNNISQNDPAHNMIIIVFNRDDTVSLHDENYLRLSTKPPVGSYLAYGKGKKINIRNGKWTYSKFVDVMVCNFKKFKVILKVNYENCFESDESSKKHIDKKYFYR